MRARQSVFRALRQCFEEIQSRGGRADSAVLNYVAGPSSHSAPVSALEAGSWVRLQLSVYSYKHGKRLQKALAATVRNVCHAELSYNPIAC